MKMSKSTQLVNKVLLVYHVFCQKVECKSRGFKKMNMYCTSWIRANRSWRFMEGYRCPHRQIKDVHSLNRCQKWKLYNHVIVTCKVQAVTSFTKCISTVYMVALHHGSKYDLPFPEYWA